MKAPPLLLAAALLFWGWQNENIVFAALMALLLESAWLIRSRWEIGDRDFHRIADLSSVAFLGLVIYQFSEHALQGIYYILEWMPATLSALLAVQSYSRQGTVPLSALFVSLRRSGAASLTDINRHIDLGYPYLVVCLVSAGAGNHRTPEFFLGACALIGWALWPLRPRRYGSALWMTLMVLACAMGFGAQLGLQRAQAALEGFFVQWLYDQAWTSSTPDRAITAIGTIGRLKLSDRIRVRMRTDRLLPEPLLLREASYSTYRSGTWGNKGINLLTVDPRPGIRSWPLAAAPANAPSLDISTYLKDETGVVPIPHGSVEISGDDILEVRDNRYGTVMLESRPGYIRYHVAYDPAAFHDPPPTEHDLAVPPVYDADLTKIAESLHLRGRSAPQAVSTVAAFFRDNFTYSLVQRGTTVWSRPLSDFLLRRRSGHCEYFATATVLLLRKAGIPARYAVGYSVSEYSPVERQYIARARDAHAWSLAYVDGRWQVLDTTPGVWHEQENEAASVMQGLFDLTSWIGYRFARWRAGDAGMRPALPWAILPLSLWLLWRLRGARRARTGAPGTGVQAQRHLPGQDSEFFAVVRRLIAAGYELRPGETLSAWLRRIEPLAFAEATELAPLLELHYRHRFDPEGLDAAGRARLRIAEAMLQKTAPPGSGASR